MAKILDTDILVLQRQNAREFPEPNTPPGSYPKLMYDLETYKFYGADLRETVGQYINTFHDFVLLTGDKMSGNLEIEFPEEGNNVEQPVPAKLTLTGYQKDSNVFGEVRFKNRGSTSNFSVAIGAVQPQSSSTQHISHIKIGNKASVTVEGKLYVSRHVCASGGGGFLTYIPDADWDKTNNLIKKGIDENQHRLKWNDYGGNLTNANGLSSLRWSNNGYGVKLFDDDEVEVVKTIDGHLRYSNPSNPLIDLTDEADLTHKKYVDDNDALYIPLEGTRVADVSTYPAAGSVWGPIDFTTTGYLNAKMGVGLKLKYTDIDVITVESHTDSYGAKLSVHSDSFYNDNSLIDVKYPETAFQPSTPTLEDTHAVPRKYVDDRDKELLAKFQNLPDLASPPGMVNAFVGATAPDGWLLCDGSTFNELTYPELYALLGTNTTPDMRGRYLAMPGSNDAGSSAHLISSALLSKPNAKTGKPKSSNFSITATTAQDGIHSHNMVTGGSHSHNYNLSITHQKQDEAKSENNGNGGYELVTPGSSRNDGNHVFPVNGNISSSSNHVHTINNSVTHNHNVTVLHENWDDYTRPDTFVINWIIKHDN